MNEHEFSVIGVHRIQPQIEKMFSYETSNLEDCAAMIEVQLLSTVLVLQK